MPWSRSRQSDSLGPLREFAEKHLNQVSCFDPELLSKLPNRHSLGDSDGCIWSVGLELNDPRCFFGDLLASLRPTFAAIAPITIRVGLGVFFLTVRGLSCLSTAMPFVWKKTPSFHKFASASAEEIFSADGLGQAMVFEANHLESGVLINQGPQAGFAYRPLPRLAQASPGYGVVATDLDGDGHTDVYCVQNFFWREPETGHWDGGLSLLMRGDGAGQVFPQPG